MRSRAAAALVALAGTLLVTGMAVQSWELVSLLLPLSAVLMVYIVMDRPSELDLTASWELGADRILASDEVDCVLTIGYRGRGQGLGAVKVLLPEGVEVREGETTFPLRFGPGGEVKVRYRLRFAHRGNYQLGPVKVTMMGLAGITSSEHDGISTMEVRVLPRVFKLDSTGSSSSKWRLASGNIDSRLLGPGIEFFNLREYVPGDSLRMINWKATARADAITVNDFMTQRSCDIIIALDHSSMKDEAVLDISVDMAASLCGHFLQQRNRVGLAVFGDCSRVLPMGYGRRQLQLCLEILADAAVPREHPPLRIAESVGRFFPRDSAVVMVTGLGDARAVGTAQKLIWQGRELVVVAPFAAPVRSDFEERREEVRRQDRAFQLRQLCPVEEWNAFEPEAWSLPRRAR